MSGPVRTYTYITSCFVRVVRTCPDTQTRGGCPVCPADGATAGQECKGVTRWEASRPAGEAGAALGVITVVFMVGVAVLSFTSWSPPNWSRIVIGATPAITWAALMVFSIIGWWQHQRWALLGFACCAASVVAIMVMANIAY